MGELGKTLLGIVSDLSANNPIVGAALVIMILMSVWISKLLGTITSFNQQKAEYEQKVHERKLEEQKRNDKKHQSEILRIFEKHKQELERLDQNHKTQIEKIEKQYKSEIRRLEKQILPFKKSG